MIFHSFSLSAGWRQKMQEKTLRPKEITEPQVENGRNSIQLGSLNEYVELWRHHPPITTQWTLHEWELNFCCIKSIFFVVMVTRITLKVVWRTTKLKSWKTPTVYWNNPGRTEWSLILYSSSKLKCRIWWI